MIPSLILLLFLLAGVAIVGCERSMRMRWKNAFYRFRLRCWNALAHTGLVKHHWFYGRIKKS